MNMRRHGLPFASSPALPHALRAGSEIRHELSRRDLLRLAGVGFSGLGLAAIVGCGDGDEPRSGTSTPPATEPPPETTTIRLAKIFSTCTAPLHLAGLFLPEEGFTNVQYIDDTHGDHASQQTAAGEIDITLGIVAELTSAVDADEQLIILAGVHNTCFELFASDRVQTLRDLKGKRIHAYRIDASDPTYVFMATLLAYVGIDLQNEVEFVELSMDDGLQQLKAGTIDAMLGFPPISAQMRANNIGHVVLNGMMDTPWSQYFCCMATGNRDFVEKHPVATKRALRAILKAADLCAKEPERAARYLVDTGYTHDYESVLDTMTALSYAAWREFNPEDTVRFNVLRLNEAGLVKSTPEALITRATDWRLLEELKQELKA
jgi:NitT/TauT family transport system substrate-binding protein